MRLASGVAVAVAVGWRRFGRGRSEHLAWKLDASSGHASSGRWVSPQVPHNLWNLFRLGLQLLGLLWLRMLALTPLDGSHGATHAVGAFFFHLLCTVVVGLQVQVSLVRTVVNLARRRHQLEQHDFDCAPLAPPHIVQAAPPPKLHTCLAGPT